MAAIAAKAGPASSASRCLSRGDRNAVDGRRLETSVASATACTTTVVGNVRATCTYRSTSDNSATPDDSATPYDSAAGINCARIGAAFAAILISGVTIAAAVITHAVRTSAYNGCPANDTSSSNTPSMNRGAPMY